ncbi:hypothetical protein [Dyadobacter frigoris]|uniref:Uncharacterized protein n=1 Tax=Dyadobacter frigoris TaxID=2576211 RepID=A0A4U6D971_9BACT|nr:hypothetical protein [Dyadobacter frigoris]TKT92688.1 hypothetical protein FDK13_07710 [Dyadobacter frigoris]GLU51578.1 hypothetical protein Dfri01_10390 [Dyadobacter frigoris]
MSKRLIRIASKNIASELTNLSGLELNAILRTGNTYFGKLMSVTNEHLTLQDTRQHTHKLAIQDLFEVVYDYKDKK